ncbi:ATP-binding protein [Bifidobacterium sp. ESL0784]|uniref:ATP-binding protein n=1 Tax=Bifidobacterium sp. ESL0784 TaxID=2983231 RepID=UPI0023F65BE5|nr:ATP-binding protein [Bifidobacterium sp. ESL0784]MDF7640549.1 ATP-binding protein [Bifidobacterium sp. ESL0784]
MGLCCILVSENVRDTGRILENIVFLELKHRAGTVYVGHKALGGEIDFVANSANGLACYQDSESVRDPKTLERELSSFRTLDDELSISYNGIQRRSTRL